MMDDIQDEQARLIHCFSSPLTAMRGAIDLLRRPRRMSDDPLTRELLETLDRSCVRLCDIMRLLIDHSAIAGDQVEISVLLKMIEDIAHKHGPGALHQPVLSSSSSSSVEVDTIPPVSLPDAPVYAGGSVLVVEGNAAYRSVIWTVLSDAGYDVLEATNGMHSVDLARANHPDLILLDLDLPLLDGYQIAQVLREDPETKAIPIIYTSSYNRQLPQLPAHSEVLSKAAAPTVLLQTVQQTITAGQARMEQPPTILVVDDDPDILSIVNVTMHEDSYRVVTATTGAEALMLAQKQSFELIILDLLLPDIDGFSVLAALRVRPPTALTPILLLSARDSAPEKVRGFQIGADDYITKPFVPAELSARVQAALRRRELEGGANPSTRLPGNTAIERTIRRRIEDTIPFAVCYTDLDNFKAYNDTYGFLKGDAVIHQTAHVLLAAVEQHGNHDDFVGHIGGDDFVVITTPDRAMQICEHAISAFDAIAPLFYDAETRQRGYIDAHDRQGRATRFPLVSLSIAVVSNAQQAILHLAEVAQRSVDLKKRAKEIVGSAYVSEDDLRRVAGVFPVASSSAMVQ